MKIFVAKHILKYNDLRVFILHISIYEYSRLQRQRKEEKHSDYFYERVTEERADQIQQDQEQIRIDNEYNQRIMKKYNVGSSWMMDRYFVEQIRPTAL